MRLRNKKTGKIYECRTYGKTDSLWKKQGTSISLSWKIADHLWEGRDYKSLAELTEEWEDYEEPKHDYYFIRDGGNIDYHWYQKLGEITERRKEIGNYFETEKEAEKAVLKLKAIKRLKDEGFEFNGVGFDEHGRIYIKTNLHCIELDAMENPGLESRLNLIFGGEE